MPGLATANSVFAWTGTPAMPLLQSRVTVTGLISEVVNIRQNTATGGVSTDVPTWAAGCVICMRMKPAVVGTSGFFIWSIQVPIVSGATPIMQYETLVVPAGLGELRQVIVPFFDEPLFTSVFNTNGTGTATYSISLLGFVRNV
jgi:hypothetical protein